MSAAGGRRPEEPGADGPPLWLHSLLLALLPDRRAVRAALGDLYEGWPTVRSRGVLRAHAWYVVHGLSLLRYHLTDRTELGPGLRVSLRALVLKPLLPLTGLLTLSPALAGLGLGGALAWTILLRPLPHPDADRLVVVEHTWEGFGTTGISSPLHAFYEGRSRALDRLGLVSWTGVAVAGSDGRATRERAARVTAATLELLGATPVHGRLFTREEDRSVVEGVLLGHGLWRDRFGADPTIVGRSVRVEGASLEVVGVLAPGLEIPGGDARLVMPAAIRTNETALLNIEWWYALGRLASGVDAAEAERELGGLLQRAVEEIPDGSTTLAALEANGIAPVVTPLAPWTIGPARDFVVLLEAAVALLFVLALAAMLNVLVGRSEARAGELALRRILGADTPRLVAQLGGEALLVCALLGAAGALGAWIATGALLDTAALELPRSGGGSAPGLAALLAFAAALALVPLFALVPLHHARDASTVAGRRPGPRATGSRRLRHVLLGGQVAVSTVLLVAALALGASIRSLLERPAGFEPEGVLTFAVSLPWSSHPGWDETRAFHRELGSRLAALPGVRSASYASGLPAPGESWGGATLRIEGEPDDGTLPTYNWAHVAPGTFRTLGIPVLAGRPIEASDMREAPAVMVVNEAFARQHWARPEDALGRRVHRSGRAYEIVGVVGNTAGDGRWGEPAPPLAYVPGVFSPWHMRDVFYLVRTELPPTRLAADVRGAVADVDPMIPVFEMGTLEERIEAGRAREELALRGVGLSGVASLAVVAASLAGLLLLTILQRRREIGIRKAVGATDPGLRWELLRGVLAPSAVGLAAGAAAVAAGLRVPESLLHGGVAGAGPLAPVAGIIAAFVLAAGYVTSRRVTAIEPAEALRAD